MNLRLAPVVVFEYDDTMEEQDMVRGCVWGDGARGHGEGVCEG